MLENNAYVNRVIGRIKTLKGRRRTGKALYYASKKLFLGRPKCGRKRVLIVLTSGVSADRVSKPSKRLAALGVVSFVLVTKRVGIRQMEVIATTRKHVTVVAYKSLTSLTAKLSNRICNSPKGKNKSI